MAKAKSKPLDVVIVGGLGHVGLPLGLVLANTGLKVCLQDIDTERAKMVRQGLMPFIEYGAEPILKRVLKKKNALTFSSDPASVGKAKYVVIAIGTPVDEYLNPKIRQFLSFFNDLKQYLSRDQIIIIRSTVFPRICQEMASILDHKPGPWHIAYCPERIAQGYAIKELKKFPQLVAGLTPKAEKEAAALFQRIAPKVLRVKMEEAELAKLFSNAWRYLQFSIANQFYMLSHDFGVDFARVRAVMAEGYGRAANIPSAGFAAGPCLMKDTLQLAAFSQQNFLLGHAAMMVNEGLPNFIVESLKAQFDIKKKKIGILGMTFKADIDDNRDSLSYKLGKLLRFNGAKVYYSDEYIEDPTFVIKEKLIKECEVVILGVPHTAYKTLKFPVRTKLVDPWGIFNSAQKIL